MDASGKTEETGRPEGLSTGRPLVIQQRNLPKSDLRGVIFGCTNGTISECLNKQLFGLPGAHINYVQNIEPGLPLFLFNYSNRTLLGVYEAASRGQMNIDPHGWTKNGKQRTQFPAQVRICVKMLCQPMAEIRYRHIIKDNYYSAKHFYFELDHMQVDGLLSLFASVPPSESVVCLSHMEDDNNMLILSGVENWNVNNQSTDARKRSQNPEEETEVVSKLEKLQIDDSISPIERMQPEHPSNKGKLIFNDELSREVDETRGTCEGTCGTSKLFPEVCDDKDAIMMDSHCGVEVHNQLAPTVKGLMERISILEKKQLELESQVEQLKRREVDQGRKYEEMCQHMKHEPSNGSLVCQMSSEQLIYLIGGYDGNSLLNTLSSFSPFSDVSSTLASMSSRRSYAAATSLNHLLFVFGGRNSDLWLDTVECYNPIDNKWKICPSLSRRKGSLAGATLNGRIFAVGGGNGVDCFYDFEIFDASLGKWIEGQSMHLKRFAPAVADLNGIFYASGGYNGDGYLDSVEQFDPRVGSWSWLSSMNYRRASHSLVVLNEKLYAVGGYDGERFVSSTEVYDPRKGSWLLTEPMHTERAYAGCAVLGDSLFVMGGVREEGRIVDDVELYKEKTGWAVAGFKSVGKRAYFSAVVL